MSEVETKRDDIVEAINNGSSDEEIASSFGVTAEEVAGIRAEVANSGDTPVEDGNVPAGEGEPEAGAEAPAEGEGEASEDEAPAEGEGDAPAEGGDDTPAEGDEAKAE